METTSEGIESLDQLDLIRGLNVSHVQGYIYSKPVPQAELLDHAAAGSWTIKPSGPARQRNDRFSLFRKVGAIHDNHRYAVVIRNLSTTGPLIEGIIDRQRVVSGRSGSVRDESGGRRMMNTQKNTTE